MNKKESDIIHRYLQQIGAKGGKVTSEAKTKACQRNAKRPKRALHPAQVRRMVQAGGKVSRHLQFSRQPDPWTVADKGGREWPITKATAIRTITELLLSSRREAFTERIDYVFTR